MPWGMERRRRFCAPNPGSGRPSCRGPLAPRGPVWEPGGHSCGGSVLSPQPLPPAPPPTPVRPPIHSEPPPRSGLVFLLLRHVRLPANPQLFSLGFKSPSPERLSHQPRFSEGPPVLHLIWEVCLSLSPLPVPSSWFIHLCTSVKVGALPCTRPPSSPSGAPDARHLLGPHGLTREHPAPPPALKPSTRETSHRPLPWPRRQVRLSSSSQLKQRKM